MSERRSIQRCRTFAGIALICIFGALLVRHAHSQPLAAAGNANIDAMVEAGRAAVERGDIAAALNEYQEALRLQPKHVQANYRLGELYWRQEQPQQAIEYFLKSVEYAPTNYSLRLAVGNFLEQARMIDRAIEEYQIIIERARGTPEAAEADKRLNLLLARNYSSAGDLDTAMQLLRALVDQYPDDSRVLQHLGFAYLLAGQFEAAAATFEDVIERDPSNDTAFLNLATVYESMGNLQQAQNFLSKVATSSADPNRRKEAQIRLGLMGAFRAMQESKPEQARLQLESVVNLDAENASANMQLASIYRGAGEYDKAEKALLSVIRGAPGNAEARVHLGNVYIEQNNYIDGVWQLELVANAARDSPSGQTAVQMLQRLAQTLGDQFAVVRDLAIKKNEFKQAVFLDPNNVAAHYNLGLIFREQRQTDNAIDAFENTRRINPDFALAYAQLGDLYAQKRELEKSVDAYLNYVARQTDVAAADLAQAPMALVLGQWLMGLGRNEAALHHFRRVAEKVPDDPATRFYMAATLAQMGQLSEAAQEYEFVIEKLPDHHGARLNLGLVYERLGKEAEALNEFQRVALTAPTAEARDFADAKVTQLKRAINGVTATASYVLSVDNNANLSNNSPSEEVNSGLSFNAIYRYKYNDRLRLGFSVAPSYTSYHRGQYDYLNQSYNPFVIYEKGKKSVTLRSNYSRLSAVLNQNNVNESSTWTLDYNETISDLRTWSGGLDHRVLNVVENDLFDAKTDTLRATYNRNLNGGLSDNINASYTLNKNFNAANRASAYQSLTVGYQLNRWFSSSLYVSAGLNASYTEYRFAELNNPMPNQRIQREILNISGSLSANYRLNDQFRFVMSLSSQYNDANLPIFVFANNQVVAREFDSQDLIGIPLQSASLGDFSKFIVSGGVAVNF